MIDNKTLHAEIILCKKSNQISDKLGEIIVELVEKQLSKPNFYNWPNKDDMAAHAYFHLCYCILKFNPTSTNPIAFCNTVITSAFRNFVGKNKRHLEVVIETQPVESLYNEDRFFVYQLEVNISLNMKLFNDWAKHCRGTWKINEIDTGKYKLMFTHENDFMFAKLTFG